MLYQQGVVESKWVAGVFEGGVFGGLFTAGVLRETVRCSTTHSCNQICLHHHPCIHVHCPSKQHPLWISPQTRLCWHVATHHAHTQHIMGTRDMLLFNIGDGYSGTSHALRVDLHDLVVISCTVCLSLIFTEGIVRGLRSGLLTAADYSNITQCESLDDIKLYLVWEGDMSVSHTKM